MGSGKTITIEGSKQVQDAVIDFDLVDKNLGAEPRNNALIKRERGNAFLVKFGLGTLPANAVMEKATLVLSVWDPSSQGRTECRIHPLRTPWKSDQVTWKAPTWANGASFDIAKDAMPSIKSAIVEPDQGADTADPPIAVQFDITPLVRDWLSGKQVNQGVAVVPTPNREVDEGFNTRFQIWASEAPKHGPKLILQLR